MRTTRNIGVLGCGMIAEFSHALWTGEARKMPTAADGLSATVVSQAATQQAIADRDGPSQSQPSTMQRSQCSTKESNHSVPLDDCELVDDCELE